MRIRSKVLATATTVALAMGVAAYAVPSAGAAALPKHDAANDKVTCNDIIGKIKFSVPLHLGGTTANQVTISIKSDDCLDTTAGLYDSTTNPGGVSLKGASSKGILASSTNDCLGLQGLSTATSGDIALKWTTNSGTPGLLNAASTFHIGQDWGGTFNDGGQTSPATARDSWGAQYGWFAIGGATSGRPMGATEQFTTNPSMTGAFTGGNGGATSWFEGTTNQTAAALGTACFSTGGIKGVTFGIGGLTFQ